MSMTKWEDHILTYVSMRFHYRSEFYAFRCRNEQDADNHEVSNFMI